MRVMKIKSLLIVLCAALVALFFSCSKDFNSNADYKDVTIVYGILNVEETTHYLKIYRGFLTAGDAAEVAQCYDSLYYFDKIEVEVEEYVNERKTNTWQLDTTTQIPMNSGDFASPKQLLYTFTQTLNPEATYLLRITNKETGRVVTAQTNVTGSFLIDPHMARYQNIVYDGSYNFNFYAADNAVSYEVFQNFYYIERNKTTHEEVVKCIRRHVNSYAITTTTMAYSPSALLDRIVADVQPNDQVDRYISVDSCMQFEVWAYNEPLHYYVQSTTSTSSVVMDKLVYTNVEAEDGLCTGILGSRAYATSWHGLNNNSQEELVNGSRTRHLGFHYAWEYLELDD